MFYLISVAREFWESVFKSAEIKNFLFEFAGRGWGGGLRHIYGNFIIFILQEGEGQGPLTPSPSRFAHDVIRQPLD